MVSQGRVVRSRIDYILGSDRRIFQNVAVRDPRDNSDHIMVLECMRGSSPSEHPCYRRRRTCLLLRLPGRQTRKQADKIFDELRHTILKQEKLASHHNSWILAETWRLVDERVSARREPGRDHQRIRRLGRAIQATLKGERRHWAVTAGEDVKRILSVHPPHPCEAWKSMWGYYSAAVDHAPPPA